MPHETDHFRRRFLGSAAMTLQQDARACSMSPTRSPAPQPTTACQGHTRHLLR